MMKPLINWGQEETSPATRLFHNCLLPGFLHLPLKQLVLATDRILDKMDRWADLIWQFPHSCDFAFSPIGYEAVSLKSLCCQCSDQLISKVNRG